MAKFTTDYVNLIANNLRDRYKTGFPILKELVQNADDAGATSLAFGYHVGFGSAADHMLLQGPALWVLNDGRFLPSDREAIHSFGLNGKAAETGAIGKFGLGMKSVFHLCESFFYVASSGTQIHREILNPWLQDEGSTPVHQQWETITDRDVTCFHQVLDAQEEARADTSWFMLWVPLRCRAHIVSGDDRPMAAIIDRFPGDSGGQDLDFFTQRDIDRRIGSLLPLLRHLRQVRFGGTPSLSAFHVALEIGDGARRLDHATDGVQISGSVSDQRPRGEHLRFYARQRVSGPTTTPFAELLVADTWPKSMAIVGDGKRAQVPDKARPEGAVMLSHADKREGRLTLQWAVFLPTEEVRFSYEARIPNSSREYSIVLHGQFFVDAGRRGIGDMDALHVPRQPLATDATQPMVLRQWNQALAQDVVLPSLLEALAEYVRVHGLKDDDVHALASALRQCAAVGDAGSRVEFFAQFRTHVCREHAWIRRLDRSCRTWTLVRPSGHRLLPLPPPAALDHDRPWRALPGLSQVRDTTFVDSDAPNLVAALANWDADLLLTALKGLGGPTLKGEKELAYLVQFLEMEADREVRTSRVQDELVGLVRRALQEIPLSDVRQNRSMFKRLVALLPADRRFALGTRDPNARGALNELAFRRLLHCPTRALLVPGDLAPDGESSSANDEDLCTWLQALALLPDGRPLSASATPDAWLDLAETLIEAAGDRPRQLDLLRRNARLSVLKAFGGRDGRVAAISLSDLTEAHKRGWLFKVSDPNRPLGLLPKLAAALTDIRPLVVRAAVASFVDAVRSDALERVPGAEDPTALLRAAGAEAVAPAIGGQADRSDLLSIAATASLDDPVVVRGIRYLLHGSADHYHGNEVLWKDPVGQKSPWVRLWRMVDEAPWRVLADDLCGSIPDRCAGALNIKAVDETSVLNRLRVCTHFAGVDATRFTPDEIDLILGRVTDEHPWRRLPLHRHFGGRYGAVEGSSYLGRFPELPAGLTQDNVFVEPSSDADHVRLQSRFLPLWGAASAASAVLRSTRPELHWRYLMDLLGQHRSLVERPPEAWNAVAWLPLASGGAIALDSLIRLDTLDADISDLARRCEYAFAGGRDLSADVLSHPAYPLLHGQISSGEDALPVLGQMMSAAGLSIGWSVRQCYREVQQHLSTLVSIRSLPAWGILERAAVAASLDAVEVHLLPEVAKQLSMGLCLEVLGEISFKAADGAARAVFGLYLREWRSSAAEADLRNALRGLRLPSAAGTWVPAAELVTGVSGVMPEFVLEETLCDPLIGVAVDNRATPSLEPTDGEGQEVSKPGGQLLPALEEYFEPLIASSVRPAVGAVIGLFGDQVASLAKSWLDPIAYEDYVCKLGWRDPGREDGFDRRVKWMGERTLSQALKTLTIRVVVQSGSHVRARSLTGAEVDVRIEPVDDLRTLYVMSEGWQGFSCRVRLRPASALLGKEPHQQRDILMRTAESVLKDLYNQPHANLSELFALFDEADQVTLDVARGLILEGLPQSLRALPGIGKNRKLAQALAALDEARRNVASAKRSGRAGAAAGLERALAELASLVESDVEVQATVLAGIKARVTHNQYEPASIPFEIFQNADDAVAEMQQLQHADGRSELDGDAIGRFVMQASDRMLRFAHWGRPVNYAGRLVSYKPDFANDLERMLMLGASAKDDEDGVTGKFGLGFKSVLLASSNPRVWSGDLCFDVVGGCLPRKWRPTPATKQFQQAAHTPSQRALRGTLVELPLDARGSDAEVVDRFAGLAGLLPVFARRLRCVVVGDESHTWQPAVRNLGHGVQCEVGSVSLPVKGGRIHARLLVLRSRQGTAVMRLGASGVEEFDRDSLPAAPCIWVTAPTRGTPARGVLLNAPFQIDTGRATLALGKGATQLNTALAEALAGDLAPALVELQVRAEADWPGLGEQLGCTLTSSPAEFWSGLWGVLLAESPDDEAAMDVRLVDRFACRLFRLAVERTGKVPNGLKGQAAALISAKRICLSVNVDYLGGVLEPLRRWGTFVQRYPIDGWCADATAGWLERSGCVDEGDIPSLVRAHLVDGLPGGRLLPEEVPDLTDVLLAWPRNPGEAQGWRSDMAPILLRSRAGTWAPPRALIRGKSADEDLLAGFAPDRAILDPCYEPSSHAFSWIAQFLAPSHFDAATLAGWCIYAEGGDAQAAAIYWLVRHVYDPVLDELRAKRHLGGWLYDLTDDSRPLSGLAAEEKHLLLTKLGLATGEEDQVLPGLSPSLDLAALHGWWAQHGSRWLTAFDERFWPAGVDKNALRRENPHDRTTWMTLFSLGLFRRYGRVTDEQHRGFLEFLDRKGWWRTICEVDPDSGAEAWMDILRAYGEGHQAETLFELWMDSFPRIYRIARWLDVYVHLFTTLDRRDSKLARFLLSPASDPSLSGSGIEAPTLSGMLRLGQHLVVRELLRVEVLTSDVAKALAFAPGRGVLELMARLGHGGVRTGSDIYETLRSELGEEGATFRGAYDIPLQLVATNEQARREAEMWADRSASGDNDGSDEQEMA